MPPTTKKPRICVRRWHERPSASPQGLQQQRGSVHGESSQKHPHSLNDPEMHDHLLAIEVEQTFASPPGHRSKNCPPGLWCILVAKTIHPKDPLSRCLQAIKAIDAQPMDLEKMGTWGSAHPFEAKNAARFYPDAHFARVFAIVGVKQYEQRKEHHKVEGAHRSLQRRDQNRHRRLSSVRRGRQCLSLNAEVVNRNLDYKLLTYTEKIGNPPAARPRVGVRRRRRRRRTEDAR